MNFSTLRPLIVGSGLLLASLLTGCAHNNPRDPFEPLNRGIYRFNDAVDRAVIKPVATAYRDIIPQPIRNGVRNFFSNVDDILVALNDLLQGKVPDAINDAGRVLVNTTLGVFGIMDIATQLGVEKRNEDFGQTLGFYGIGTGPYLVLPFFGPSNIRDGIGLYVDLKLDPLINSIGYVPTRNMVIALRVVSKRASLLDTTRLVDEAALDSYSFVRDAYLQRRRSLVHDGNPPPEADEELEDLKQKPRGELESVPQAAGGGDAPAPAEQSSTPVPAPATATVPAKVSEVRPPVTGETAPRVLRVWLPTASR